MHWCMVQNVVKAVRDALGARGVNWGSLHRDSVPRGGENDRALAAHYRVFLRPGSH